MPTALEPRRFFLDRFALDRADARGHHRDGDRPQGRFRRPLLRVPHLRGVRPRGGHRQEGRQERLAGRRRARRRRRQDRLRAHRRRHRRHAAARVAHRAGDRRRRRQPAPPVAVQRRPAGARPLRARRTRRSRSASTSKIALLNQIDVAARRHDPRITNVHGQPRRRAEDRPHRHLRPASSSATSSRWCASASPASPRSDGTPPAGHRRRRRTRRVRLPHRGRPLAALGAAPPPTRRCATCSAVDAPAGTMTVVLGPGWPGVLLHEAVGHGLEGDFNRKDSLGLQRPHRRARRVAALHRGRRRHHRRTGAARSTATTKARRPAAPC